MRAFNRTVAVLTVLVAVAVVLTWLLPGRDGPYALLTILTPHAAVAAIVTAGIVVVLLRGRASRAALLVLVVVAGARFGSEWVSMPSDGGTAGLTAATWNLEYSDVGVQAAIDDLSELEADVVALQELTPEQATAIEATPAITERFPYRHLVPGSQASGIGLLSRHPLIDPVAVKDPVSVTATVDAPGGPITVLNAHPYPARIAVVDPFWMPVGFDRSVRDGRLATVRDRLDAATALGNPVLLIGDFNTAPTEAAFRELTAGLLDSHVEVGQGPGWTWRPKHLGRLPMGLLRIDLVLSTPDLKPVESRIECPPVGDHCRVIVGFARAS